MDVPQAVAVYVIVTAPATKPDTNPEDETEAVVVLLLLHAPPAGVAVREMPDPSQTEEGPLIDAVPDEPTVIRTVAKHPEDNE
jgi:hypothetical protein